MKTITLPSHVVRARRFWYGQKETFSIAFVGTLKECREFIKQDDCEVYRLEHNESGRPILRIVTTASLRPCALRDAEYRAEEQAKT